MKQRARKMDGRPNCPPVKLRLFYTVMAILLSACQPAIFDPPRLATETAPGLAGPPSTPEPILLPAPTASASSERTDEPILTISSNPPLTVWINETSDEHKRVLQSMLDEFEQEEQIDVELMLVSPALLPELMETAVMSDTLPDIVLHPVAYTAGWAERDILNSAIASEVIDQIGRETFDPDVLDLVEVNGLTAAIPSDGYQQLLIYRADWFVDLGLAVPDDYEALLAAAEALFDPEALVSGIVIPTESNLVTTHQGFEHFATANGCELIDEKGEVLILEPECQEAMDFYRSLVSQYSPIGVQTDTSARNAYLAGRTGMIMTSPDILPKLAGLDSSALPTCRECAEELDYLAQNTGIVTHLKGRDSMPSGANFGEIIFLGITREADKEAAAKFANYWFNQGYNQWLAIESERKVPMRWGTVTRPQQYIDGWGSQPLADSELSLREIYGEEVVTALGSDVANSDRWALRQGQGAVLTPLYEELIISVVLQEMLSGYFGSSQTLAEIYLRVTELIPNYAYYPVATPTPEPED